VTCDGTVAAYLGLSHEEYLSQTCVLAVPRTPRRGLGLATEQIVDCWIGVVQEANRRLVRLAGRLSIAQVPELLGACAEALPIDLDLTDLVSADAAGIEALQRLRSQGATLLGAPGYIQLKLDSHTGSAMSAPAQAQKRRPTENG
jgi:hypothetical protein